MTKNKWQITFKNYLTHKPIIFSPKNPYKNKSKQIIPTKDDEYQIKMIYITPSEDWSYILQID